MTCRPSRCPQRFPQLWTNASHAGLVWKARSPGPSGRSARQSGAERRRTVEKRAGPGIRSRMLWKSAARSSGPAAENRIWSVSSGFSRHEGAADGLRSRADSSIGPRCPQSALPGYPQFRQPCVLRFPHCPQFWLLFSDSRQESDSRERKAQKASRAPPPAESAPRRSLTPQKARRYNRKANLQVRPTAPDPGGP